MTVVEKKKSVRVQSNEENNLSLKMMRNKILMENAMAIDTIKETYIEKNGVWVLLTTHRLKTE